MTREFADIGAFLKFMAGATVKIDNAVYLGLHAAGQIVQEEAHSELGHYQDRAGPFPEWPELTDQTKRARVEHGWTENDPLLRSGALADHIELSVSGHRAAVGVPSETVGDGTSADPIRDIGDIAVDMELGTARIPPRSFLGRAWFVKGPEASEAAAWPVVAALAGLPIKVSAAVRERAAADSVYDIPF